MGCGLSKMRFRGDWNKARVRSCSLNGKKCWVPKDSVIQQRKADQELLARHGSEMNGRDNAHEERAQAPLETRHKLSTVTDASTGANSLREH